MSARPAPDGANLFSHHAQAQRVGQPLAERMRPRRLDEVVGQPQLLGEGRLLRQILSQTTDRGGGRAFLPSLILWGPPGCGKTTLGGLLAAHVGARFAPLSAVHSGVKELRAAIEDARQLLVERGVRTVLFIDEIHRYNKAQQDALLPHVEAGTVVLLGATTENPGFEINGALLSRCRVLRLQPHRPDDLQTILQLALSDRERGLGTMAIELADEVRDQLIRLSAGDARRLLSTLEALVYLTPAAEDGVRRPTSVELEQALAQKLLPHDKDGELHHDIISALIKSVRGSDPDAALYWTARMLEAGEDPLYVLRRLVILAAEDIGPADPRALPMATATVEAVRFVGMPEGHLAISALVLFLSVAPKSNSALVAYAAARAAVEEHGALPVPIHLRDGHSSTARALGHGAGYRYPHDFPGHHVPQRYLPDELPESALPFYRPAASGFEQKIDERLRALRRT
ncbi:MAG TPA: replication-associated recombination protein A [Pseudomonadota bacterium]|nr:replication-associated recombination protein A [Pseudomonadota bacterium]